MYMNTSKVRRPAGIRLLGVFGPIYNGLRCLDPTRSHKSKFIKPFEVQREQALHRERAMMMLFKYLLLRKKIDI